MRFLPLFAAVLLLCPIGAAAQSSPWAQIAAEVITVSGVVLDEATGEPLQGATVWIRGLPIGMVTGADGTYTLANVPNRNLTLRVTRLGFVPEARELWVCMPEGDRPRRCVPQSENAQELRFYMRPAPDRRPPAPAPLQPRRITL